MKKILTIDDKSDNLVVYKAIFKQHVPDYVIISALSGAEGIELAIKELPDVIVLDIIMPGMDGYETCKTLKNNSLTKHIPIVLATAIKTDSHSRIRGLEIGADAFIAKPIDEGELIAQINVMLRIKEAEDRLRQDNLNLEALVQKRTLLLAESETKYRASFENTKDYIVVISEDGRFLHANKKMINVSGYSLDELLAMETGEALHIFLQSQLKDNFEKIKAGFEIPVFESVLQTKSGENICVEISLSTLIDCYGYKRVFQGNIRDITKRRRAEEKLQLNELRLSVLKDLSNMIDGNETELFDFILERGVLFSKSKIGFLGFVDDKEELFDIFSWSSLAMKECRVVDRPTKLSAKNLGFGVKLLAPESRKLLTTTKPMKVGLFCLMVICK